MNNRISLLSIVFSVFILSSLVNITIADAWYRCNYQPDVPVNTKVGDISGFYDFHSVLKNCVVNGTWKGNDDTYPYPNTYAQIVYKRTIITQDKGTFDVYAVYINENDIIGRLRVGPVETSSAAWLHLRFPEDTVGSYRVNGIVVLNKNWQDYVITIHPSTKIRAVFASSTELTVCDTHVSLTKMLDITSWDDIQ